MHYISILLILLFQVAHISSQGYRGIYAYNFIDTVVDYIDGPFPYWINPWYHDDNSVEQSKNSKYMKMMNDSLFVNDCMYCYDYCCDNGYGDDFCDSCRYYYWYDCPPSKDCRCHFNATLNCNCNCSSSGTTPSSSTDFIPPELPVTPFGFGAQAAPACDAGHTQVIVSYTLPNQNITSSSPTNVLNNIIKAGVRNTNVGIKQVTYNLQYAFFGEVSGLSFKPVTIDITFGGVTIISEYSPTLSFLYKAGSVVTANYIANPVLSAQTNEDIDIAFLVGPVPVRFLQGSTISIFTCTILTTS